jgi:hypothetical protein
MNVDLYNKVIASECNARTRSKNNSRRSINNLVSKENVD